MSRIRLAVTMLLTGAALVAAEDARRVLTQTLERASIVA